jgi:hypothetical protein
MALLDPGGAFLRVNKSYCQLLGYAPDELLQRTFADITHPDDLAVSVHHREQLLAGEVDSYQVEKTLPDPGGRHRVGEPERGAGAVPRRVAPPHGGPDHRHYREPRRRRGAAPVGTGSHRTGPPLQVHPRQPVGVHRQDRCAGQLHVRQRLLPPRMRLPGRTPRHERHGQHCGGGLAQVRRRGRKVLPGAGGCRTR